MCSTLIESFIFAEIMYQIYVVYWYKVFVAFIYECVWHVFILQDQNIENVIIITTHNIYTFVSKIISDIEII